MLGGDKLRTKRFSTTSGWRFNLRGTWNTKRHFEMCVRKMQRTRKRKYAGNMHSCWWCYLQYIITVIPQRCHFRGKLLQKKRKQKITTSECILCTKQDSLVHTIMECSETNLCQSMLLLWDGSGANYWKSVWQPNSSIKLVDKIFFRYVWNITHKSTSDIIQSKITRFILWIKCTGKKEIVHYLG